MALALDGKWAPMVKLVDTADLKSAAFNEAYRFDSGSGHQVGTTYPVQFNPIPPYNPHVYWHYGFFIIRYSNEIPSQGAAIWADRYRTKNAISLAVSLA